MMKFLNIKRYRKFSLSEIILWIFLSYLIFYTLYLIIFKADYLMNSDWINAFSYFQATWEQKTFYPEGFNMGNDFLTNRSILLYWLFYGITQDLMLSVKLQTIVTFFLQIGVVNYILKIMKIDPCGRLLALCMYVGWMPDDIRIMLFYPTNEYVNYALVIFVSLIIRGGIWKCLKDEILNKKNFYTQIVMLASLAIISGYTSTKMVLFLYLPLCLLDVFRLAVDLFLDKKIDFNLVLMSGISVSVIILSVLSNVLAIIFHSDAITSYPIVIHSLHEIFQWDMLVERIKEVLVIMGLRGEGTLASVSGLIYILSFGVLILEVIAVYWALKKKKRGSICGEIAGYCVAALIAMILVQMLCVRGFTPRYYFMVTIWIPVLIGALISEQTAQGGKLLRIIPYSIVAIMLLGIVLSRGFIEKVYLHEEPTELMKVSAYIQENNYQYVTASYWNAGIIKGYTNGAVDSLHGDIRTLTPSYWLIDTRKFEEKKHGIPNILLLTDEEEREIIDDGNMVSVILREHANKVTKIGEYNLYAFLDNPFILVNEMGGRAGLPLENEARKTDYPYSIGFAHQNSDFNGQNELVSDGTISSHILWGPYSNSIAGSYNITLHYTIDACAEETSGVFDVALDTQSIYEKSFDDTASSVVLENVVINEGHSFEARVWVPEGMVVRIQSIEYDRISS